MRLGRRRFARRVGGNHQSTGSRIPASGYRFKPPGVIAAGPGGEPLATATPPGDRRQMEQTS